MRIKQLRESRNMQQKELAAELNLAPNTLSQYENGKRAPSKELISKIADYFDVSSDYIYGFVDTVTCKECGLTYIPTIPLDIEVHTEFHRNWENATTKYGKIYSNYSEREIIKANNRNIVKDSSNSLEVRKLAQIEVFRCLFSRSLEASNYDPQHISFEEYISMMLYNEKLKEEFGEELYNALVQEYGVAPGITPGNSYYNVYDKHSQDSDVITIQFQRLNKTNKDRVMKYIESLQNIQSAEEEIATSLQHSTQKNS